MGSPTTLGQLSVSETAKNFQKMMLQEFNFRDIFFFYCASEENKRLVLREGFPLDYVSIMLFNNDCQTEFFVYRGANCFQVEIFPARYIIDSNVVSEMLTIEGTEHNITRVGKGIEVRTAARFETIRFFTDLFKMMFHASFIHVSSDMQIPAEHPGRGYNLRYAHPYIESTFAFECEERRMIPATLKMLDEFDAADRSPISMILHKSVTMQFILMDSTEKDINLVIKWYLKTDGLNVEKIIIELNQDPPNPKALDKDEVLKDIPTRPGSKKMPSASDFYNEKTKYEDGFDIQKFDDAVITVTFHKNDEEVRLTIWNTSQPNYVEPVATEPEGYVNPIFEEEVDNEPDEKEGVKEDDKKDDKEDEKKDDEPDHEEGYEEPCMLQLLE